MGGEWGEGVVAGGGGVTGVEAGGATGASARMARGENAGECQQTLARVMPSPSVGAPGVQGWGPALGLVMRTCPSSGPLSHAATQSAAHRRGHGAGAAASPRGGHHEVERSAQVAAGLHAAPQRDIDNSVSEGRRVAHIPHLYRRVAGQAADASSVPGGRRRGQAQQAQAHRGGSNLGCAAGTAIRVQVRAVGGALEEAAVDGRRWVAAGPVRKADAGLVENGEVPADAPAADRVVQRL